MKNYLISNAEVSRKTGRNESRILEETVPSQNSDIRVKRRELPSQRDSTIFIAKKGSKRTVSVIDAQVGKNLDKGLAGDCIKL